MTDIFELYLTLIIGFIIIAYLIFGKRHASWPETAKYFGFNYRENPTEYALANHNILRWVIEGYFNDKEVLIFEEQQRVKSFFTVELKSKKQLNCHLAIYSNQLFPNGIKHYPGDRMDISENSLSKLITIQSQHPEKASELINDKQLQNMLKTLFKYDKRFIIQGDTIRFVSKINLSKNNRRLKVILDEMNRCLTQIENLCTYQEPLSVNA